MGINKKRTARRIVITSMAIFALIWVSKPDEGEAGDELKARYGTMQVTTGDLAGSRVGKLYQTYLGMETNIIPDTLVTNFDNQLLKLWQWKEKESGLKDVAKETMWKLIDEYSQSRTPTTLTTYRADIDQIAKRMYRVLDWQKMCQGRMMKSQRCLLLKEIVGTVGGRELLAYALTEIMPSFDGRLNVLIFDLMLQNACREYVESLPAIYDSYTSFSLYQPTQYAVFDTPGDIRGASIVNRYLPPLERIPGSVSMLRGDNLHKSAWLFAVRNLMWAIHRLNDQQFETLKNNWKDTDDEIVQLIAVAHHAPKKIDDMTKYWLDNDMEYDFSMSVRPKYLEYAKKTKSNYRALGSF